MPGRTIADLRRAACRFDEAAHVPLLCDGARIGWLRKAHAQRLMAWPEIFKRDATGAHLAATLDSPASRTAAIDGVVETLHKEGAITGWRNERYAVVTAFEAPPLFDIERAAARFFGTTTYAAHANGYCGSGAGCEMWLARRALTKPIDPGMAAGSINLLREVPEGVQSETIFVFDLELPREFQPRNEDGEVAEFSRVPLSAISGLLGGGEVTLDASLVMLSFLERLK
ncbi:MAG: DUF4743 domain-containing protein [Betaproteobacteria bacterium]|nr:DUF4743 domain-containing protein [Betaproteobacteria bacterium]